jgi:hypothetical protein
VSRQITNKRIKETLTLAAMLSADKLVGCYLPAFFRIAALAGKE